MVTICRIGNDLIYIYELIALGVDYIDFKRVLI